MQIVARYTINHKDILGNRGLEDGGMVQRFIDNECIKLMDPYTPFQTGTLQRSLRLNTVIGSGRLVQATPYARYLYYGEVYGPNIPIFELNGKTYYGHAPEGAELVGWFSPPKKYPTGRQLQYNGAPMRGSHWFERMVADHGAEIGEGAAKIAGGRFIK